MRYFQDESIKQAYSHLLRTFRRLSAGRLIVTADIGGIDSIIIPQWYFDNGFVVVIITDRLVTIPNCQVINLLPGLNDVPRLLAKIPKILLPRLARRSELAIWVDANIFLNPAFFSELDRGKVNEGCLTYFDHDKSRSPLLEGLMCVALGKDRAWAIAKAFWFYIANLKMVPLIRTEVNACGILLWKPQVMEARKISKIWFSLVNRGSIRDQISFPLAVRLAKAERKIFSWGISYNYNGEGAPLAIRPHAQEKPPKIHAWQKYLVSIVNLIRLLKSQHVKMRN